MGSKKCSFIVLARVIRIQSQFTFLAIHFRFKYWFSIEKPIWIFRFIVHILCNSFKINGFKALSKSPRSSQKIINFRLLEWQINDNNWLTLPLMLSRSRLMAIVIVSKPAKVSEHQRCSSFNWVMWHIAFEWNLYTCNASNALKDIMSWMNLSPFKKFRLFENLEISCNNSKKISFGWVNFSYGRVLKCDAIPFTYY